MIYNDYLQPKYARQKDYYKKAQITVIDNEAQKTYKLYTDKLKDGVKLVAKIVIDKKHASKNRYYLEDIKQIDKLTYKHICDFIFQFYEHKTTRSKLFTREHINKNKLFKYALQLD